MVRRGRAGVLRGQPTDPVNRAVRSLVAKLVFRSAPVGRTVTGDRDRLIELHEHLSATQELPIQREANRWIGEAAAVVRDLVGEEVPAPVVEARIETVADLLAHVEATENEAADAHVAEARDLCRAILDRD